VLIVFLFLKRPKIEVSENLRFLARLLRRHCFYVSNVIIAGLADGDWSELLPVGSPKGKRELQTLLHPEMLGRALF
jgi:hypothetical protein